MKQFLQNQIQVKKNEVSKDMEEKAEKERLERNRLVNLLSAEKQQSFYQQKEILDKISNFRLSNTSFKKVKDKSESQDDYSFLDEDWQMEELKTRVRDSESNRRNQVNIDFFNAVQHQMNKQTTDRKKEREDKNVEVQDRHVWEKEYKVVLDDEKNKGLKKQEAYRKAVLEQIEENKKETKNFKLIEDNKYVKMMNHWMNMDKVDKKEASNPIDTWHPGRR